MRQREEQAPAACHQQEAQARVACEPEVQAPAAAQEEPHLWVQEAKAKAKEAAWPSAALSEADAGARAE